jgi:hypothetical protein
MQEWQKRLLEAIDTKISTATSNLNFDKTYRGVVKTIGSNYIVVTINGEDYNAKTKKELTVYIGDIVSIVALKNNFHDLLINGVLRGKGGEGINGTNDGMSNQPPPPISTYIHIQLSSSDSWNVKHNLGKYPSVSIVDSAGSLVIGDVYYMDENELYVVFSSPFSGKAYLN